MTAIFANALNLPAGAKVKLNGADVGEVTSLQAKDFTARVRMRIRQDAPVYSGVGAELRSATPLGDLFVALIPDPNQPPDAPHLRDGDTLGLNTTRVAASVEELLSSMALLVNGGAIRQLVSVVNGTGNAVGGRGEKLNALLHQSTALISRLTSRSGQINAALKGTADLAAELSSRQQNLTDALASAAPAVTVIADSASQVADLIDTTSRITRQLDRFPSLQGTDTRSTIADLNDLAAAFNAAAVDPDLSINALNRLIGIFAKSTNGTSVAANVDMRQLALGWIPDMNYPGDPGFHAHDGTDWHAMVGSLRYEWNVLLGKILGPDR